MNKKSRYIGASAWLSNIRYMNSYLYCFNIYHKTIAKSRLFKYLALLN